MSTSGIYLYVPLQNTKRDPCVGLMLRRHHRWWLNNNFLTLQVLHYYLTFPFHLKLALLTQLPTSNERKIPPHLKIKPAKFHNWGFTQDLYMHICSISVLF